MSQKQLSDPSPGDDPDNPIRRPNNVETINVKPTVSTENVRRQCCNSYTRLLAFRRRKEAVDV